VRMFRDPTIPHPAGSVDPSRDVRTMEDELILADLGVVEKRLERLERDIKKGNTPELRKEQEILVRCREALEGGRPLRALELGTDDAKRLRGFQFLSAKPMLVVLNLDEADLAQADQAVKLAGIEGFIAGAATRAVPICAKIELEIAQLDEDDRQAFMGDLGLKESGLDRVIRASYDLLGYISFFTVGEDECRAWSIPRNTSAVLAAGEIHSDILRGFIRAEVVRYEHLLARGTLAANRDHGELRLEGKEYIVLDGDVINFRHAT
jgi:ribosome-binding ATPase